jgi:hypothetical protein
MQEASREMGAPFSAPCLSARRARNHSCTHQDPLLPRSPVAVWRFS